MCAIVSFLISIYLFITYQRHVNFGCFSFCIFSDIFRIVFHLLQNYTYYVVCAKKTNYTNKDMFFAIDAFLSIFRLNENSIFQFFSL